jgi:hypothetical protein
LGPLDELSATAERVLRQLRLLILIVLLASVASARAEDANLVELISRMDRLWSDRGRPGAIHDLVTLGMVAQAIDPQSFEVQWRTSRAVFWVARTQSNRFVKQAMAVRARDLAQHAITLVPERVEGHYFLAVALGEYATTSGIVRAVREGLAGRIEGAALKAYEIDRDFDRGAPMAVIGRFYFMLPWPKRDLERSRQFLEELRQRHPNALTGRYYLAETYRALGDDAAARRELEFVLEHERTPAADDPEAPSVLASSALREWFSP